jgi:hypothetical protein
MTDDLKDLREIHLAAAKIVEEVARERVPVRTGRLRRTIKASATRTRGVVSAGRNGIVPYAGPIHFGWPARNIEPQPFIYDALDARKDQIVRQYEERVGQLVERVGRETP